MRESLKIWDDEGNVIPESAEVIKRKMQMELEFPKKLPGVRIDVVGLKNINLNG